MPIIVILLSVCVPLFVQSVTKSKISGAKESLGFSLICGVVDIFVLYFGQTQILSYGSDPSIFIYSFLFGQGVFLIQGIRVLMSPPPKSK